MESRKKVLVTGGLGFIGSHTVLSLIENGFDPIIIDDCRNSQEFIHNSLEKLSGASITWIKEDYQNFDKYDQYLSDPELEGVIHFAAYKAVGESVEHPMMYFDNNVSGFIALLNQVLKHQIKNVVFSSSCTVYGQPEQNPVTEQTPMQVAESPYGATKQMCERILKDFAAAHKQVNCIALRYFNPVGAHHSHEIGELPLNKPNNLMPLVVMAAAGKIEKLTVYGSDYSTHDGTCIRDYIHVEDLAEAHVKALDHLMVQNNDDNYKFVNLGNGTGYSVLEVIEEFARVNQVDVPYVLGDRRPGDVEAIFANTDMAKDVLGWTAKKTLSDMVKDSWEWSQFITSTATASE